MKIIYILTCIIFLEKDAPMYLRESAWEIPSLIDAMILKYTIYPRIQCGRE